MAALRKRLTEVLDFLNQAYCGPCLGFQEPGSLWARQPAAVCQPRRYSTVYEDTAFAACRGDHKNGCLMFMNDFCYKMLVNVNMMLLLKRNFQELMNSYLVGILSTPELESTSEFDVSSFSSPLIDLEREMFTSFNFYLSETIIDYSIFRREAASTGNVRFFRCPLFLRVLYLSSFF